MIYLEIKESTEQAKKFIEYAKTLPFVSIVDEKTEAYQEFLEEHVKKAMKTKRVKSGNSLREII